MDSYPKELLEGVSPLIFAVDAVLNKQQHQSSGGGGNISINPNQKSTTFESFYNTIASKESINATSPTSNKDRGDSPSPSSFSPLSRYKSFRFPKTLSSSSSSYLSSNKPKHSVRVPSSKKDFFSNAHIVPVSHRHAFPPSKDPHGNQNQNIQLNTKLYKTISSSLLKRNHTTGTSVGTGGGTSEQGQELTNNSSNSSDLIKRRSICNILSSNPIQGILPSGWIEKHVHALPSTLLFVTELDIHDQSKSSATTSSTAASTSGGNTSTGTGKNATSMTSSLYDQALLEQHLLHTIENIQSTMAKKRDVPIHLVVLVKKDNENEINSSSDESILLQERVNSIKTVLRLNSNAITMLQYSVTDAVADADASSNTETLNNAPANNITTDTDASMKSQPTIKYNTKQLSKVQQVIYENSNLYYLTQVRRFKRKYALLHHDKIYDLLPFAIRYCIKIAIFYEFQCSGLDSNGSNNVGGGVNSNSNSNSNNSSYKEEDEEKMKREKSIKYWKEAYRHVIDYYTFLVEKEVESRENDDNYKKNKRIVMKTKGRTPSSLTDTDEENDDEDNEQNDGNGREADTSQNNDNVGKDSNLLPLPLPPPPSDATPTQSGVEVALVYSPKSGNGITIGAKTPMKGSRKEVDENMNAMTNSHDMIHQCRAIADWVNLKLLVVINSSITTTANIKSPSDDKSYGQCIKNLANQVRKHSQVFLSKPLTLAYGHTNNYHLNKDENDIQYLDDPIWYFYQYVAHQKQVFSEFMEQHMNAPLNDISKSLKYEVSCYLSSGKHYMSTGELLMQLGLAVRNELEQQQKSLTNDKALVMKKNMSDSGDNRQRFVGGLATSELSTIFDEESGRDHTELALGSLMHAMKLFDKEMQLSSRYANVETVLSYTKLQYLIGGILMKQGKFGEAIAPLKNALSQSTTIPSLHALLKKALIQCYKKTNTTDSADGYQRVIDSSLSLFLNTGTNESLSKTSRSSIIKDAFSVENNFSSHRVVEWPFGSDEEQPFEFALTFPHQSFAIEGDEVDALLQIHSNLKTAIQIKDILIEPNFEGVKLDLQSNMDCILMPNGFIQFSVKVVIPSDFSKTVDPIITEIQSLKTEKPTICGLTKIGGGVFPGEAEGRKTFLKGGLCLACIAVKLKVTLPNENVPSVTIKIHNAHRGSTPLPNSDQKPTSRSSTEKDDYVYSAWSRPSSFPMSSGPRVLRIVCPQPDLTIRDLTTKETEGRLMEGTVNRIMLQLEAAPTEYCSNMKMSVICTSSIEQETSKSQSLLDKEQSNINLIKVPRRPTLVKYHGGQARSDDLGDIPTGWTIRENKGQGSKDDWKPVIGNLNGGSSSYTFFDLFRPLAEHEEKEQGVCKTNFLVTISYNQMRPTQCEASKDGDLVLQEYRGSVIWCSPVRANISFLSTATKVFPCGIRHPGNAVGNTSAINDSTAVTSSGKAFLRCTIEASEARNNLAVILKTVKFESDNEPEKSNCDIELVPSGKNGLKQSNILFAPKPNELCRNLNAGMKVNIAFTARPTVRNKDNPQESITTRLGTISVDWSPVPLQHADEIHFQSEDEYRGIHGPLPIKQLKLVRQKGPLCYVEVTPFEASFETIPSMPKVGNPFEVRYKISNKTSLHQKLRVLMNDSDTIVSSNNMLVSGIINGEITLGPLEKKTLSYSLLVTKVGKISIPTFDVSSVRYNTWVVHGSSMDKVFVSP